ncbi:RNA-directed DNA polymerase, eukaryota, reverse transcriptase zinc-binding domain protein [Tanacetum coccineum]
MDVVIKEGLDSNVKIKDMIAVDKWRWPAALQSNSVLNYIPIPKLSNGVDIFLWKTKDGKIVNYTTNKAWKDRRNTSDKVNWHDFVWFTNCTPKHSFTMWVVVQNRLTTQERLIEWYPDKKMECLFCGRCPDSLNHLFFECKFTKEIWCKVKTIAEINSMPDKWKDIVNLMSVKKHNKSIKNVLVRLILAACVYFIWTERNKRHFTTQKQSCKDMIENVVYHIRLKLASLNVKRTEHVEEISRKWKIVFNVKTEDCKLLDTMDLQ